MSKGITCKQAVDYISKKEEGKLTRVQRFELWRHLAVCSLCRIFSSQNNVIIKAFRGAKGKEARLTDEEKEKMIGKLLH